MSNYSKTGNRKRKYTIAKKLKANPELPKSPAELELLTGIEGKLKTAEEIKNESQS